MKITLAKSAGFCFGVKRAVDTVYEQLEMSAAERQPIYTFGPIIHNEEVVQDLEEKGVRVLDSKEELEALTEGAPMPENTTAVNDAAGNVNFGQITFSLSQLEGVPMDENGTRTKEFEYKVTESGKKYFFSQNV